MIVLPLNRNWVLGANETRGIQLQLEFQAGIKQVFDCTRKNIRFHVKTDGVRIWGVIENLSDQPMALTPKMDLCAVLSDAEEMTVPDVGRMKIKLQKSAVPCRNIQIEIGDVIQEFDEVFSNSPGRCRGYCVEKLPVRKGVTLRKQKIRSLSHAEEAAIWPYVEQMIRDGVISESAEEPHLVPIFTVPKKQGEEQRPVLDFRKFNTYIQKEHFIAQNREHCVSGVQKFAVGSSLDICQAFHHVPLGEGIDIGFSLRGRFYRYNTLPFGYCNSGYEFQRALFKTLSSIRGRISSQLISYADDLLLLSQSREEHLRDLATVLSELMHDGWRLKKSKCVFLQQEFTFLGMRLDGDGWRPEIEVFEKLRYISPPSSAPEWRQVKGWLNQLTRFVVNGEKVVSALDMAQQSRMPTDWEAFLACLEKHTTSIMHPREHEEFMIGVDASTVGWGAVLLQKGRGIICCASGTWRTDQKHWKSNRLEVEAIVKGLTKFRPYTLGQRVAIFSDNSAVCSLMNADNTSDFVKRRLDIILEHNPDIRFIPGKSNILPDFLSRLPELFVSRHNQVASVRSKSAAEMSDDELLKWGHRGHFSVQKTQKRITNIGGYVQWKKIRQYVRDCRACQQFRRPKQSSPGRIEGINDVRDVVSCDFIGPLERGPGNVRYIFTMVDHFSRFGVAWKCCRSNAATAIRCLEDFVQRFGPIKRLMCDAASYFRSCEFRRFLNRADIDLVIAPAHSHKSNGLCERYNQTLIGRIRRMRIANDKRLGWPAVLHEAVEIINETPHDHTGHPPIDVWREGKDQNEVDEKSRTMRMQIWRSFEESRRAMIEQQGKEESLYPVGTKVWVFDHETFEALDKKFEPFWRGPYEVTKHVSTHVREVFSSDQGKTIRMHIDSLQPFI